MAAAGGGMTDPVKGISGTQGTSAGGNYSGGGFSDHHKKKSPAAPQDDLIEISQSARDRSEGKKKKSILEILKEMLD
jgi:hypothetical protein